MAVIVGVADHAGWAALVTAGPGGSLLDRRRVDLIEPGLPPMPVHHQAQALPLAEAEALVERVRASAARCSAAALEAVAAKVAGISGLALRACPELPPTIAEQIRDHRARNVADWVMYRRELARAAEARGWRVYWFDPRQVGLEKLSAHFARVRKTAGPPWGMDQRLAMAGAMAADRTADNRDYVK